MDKKELDEKLTSAAKTIRSFCLARTRNPFEAEAEALMTDHVPTHLQSFIPAIAHLEIRLNLLSEAVRILWERGVLHPLAPGDGMATTYTVLP